MSKYEFDTDAFGKTREHVIYEIDGADLLVINKRGHAINGTIIGRRNNVGTVTRTRSSETTPTISELHFIYAYDLFNINVRNGLGDFFAEKYGVELREKIFDEFSAAHSANNSNENPFCNVYLPDVVSVYDGSISESGGLSPHTSGYGSECSNVFNDFNATPYAKNSSHINDIKTYGYYWLFDIMKLIHDAEIYTFSDEVLAVINENVTNITYETSFIWDVYIIGYKEAPLKGGWVTTSVLVRWTCDAVNKATSEFLSENPDYKYRADNTLIRLSAKKLNEGGFSDPFFTDLYGTLETKIPIDKLATVAGVSNFMKDVSSFIPSSDAGDLMLYLRNTFEDLSLTDTCAVQIPLNKTSPNTDHLLVINGKLGSYVRLHYGEPEEGVSDEVVGWNDDARNMFDDDSQIYDDDISDVESEISFNSNISLLTTTYAISETNLKSIGKKLWDPSFIKDIYLVNNSPIENILSVKSFPFPIPSGGTTKNVVMGNVNMGVDGRELPASFIPVKTIGTFTVPKKYNNHLEWLNYQTKVTCYLPYIGFVELQIERIIDKTITLKYIYDVICGVCTACFYAGGVEFAKFSGTIAIDIPITSSNRAQVEAGLVRSALSGNIAAIGNIAAGSLLTGDVMGLSKFWGANSFTTKGNPSPSCDGFDEQKAFVIIDYPVYYEPTNYSHIYGYPCNLSMTIGKCNGYTEIDNVDVEGLACTESEKEMLKEILETGFYV